MGTVLKRFVIMVQFLTAIPIRRDLNATEQDYGKGLMFAPLVGLLMGGLMAVPLLLLYRLLELQSSAVLSAVTVVFYILLSGGLHLDGLGDTADGLFSNRSKERMMEIMRDSRVGTNAVLVLICVVMLNYSFFTYCFSELPFHQAMRLVVIFPVCGRIGSLISAGLSTYARSGPGLGKSFIDCCGAREVFIGAVLYAGCFFLIWGLHGLVFAVFPVLTSIGLTKWLAGKLDGAMTGDMLGAVCELNQAISLILAVTALKMVPF